MAQICYKMEIVGMLLSKRNHIRKMAKELNTNHMTITRKVNELMEENVVDFNQEGRNKLFFLKKTAEARANIFMYENYKLIMTLDKYSNLRNIIEKIQRNNKIKLAILFGSYAKKTANKSSDIDIYIESENKDLKKEFSKTNSRINIKLGKYDKTNNLIKEIENNHVIIKGVDRYYEKNYVLV